MKNRKRKILQNLPATASPLCNPIIPSPLSVAIRQTLRATTRMQIAPLMALSLAGLAAPALAQDAVVELSSLDGNTGFVLNGVAAGDSSGVSVSAAGDVNGDGVDDLLIGAGNADPNGPSSGASYVVFGASGVGNSGTLELSSLEGSNGFVLNGVAAFDRSGYSVSAAGDVNGDGIDDLLIGAPSAFPYGSPSGTSYVVFGASGVGSSGTLELSALDGSDGFVLNGVDLADGSGHSVSAAGDVNGDGVDDLLIGARDADPNGSNSGASYVVFGASGVGTGGTLELSALDGSNGFVLNGVAAFDRSGYSVSAAGDVNGDGVDDLLIGAYGAAPNGIRSGASYVVFGASGVGNSGTLELSSLDGSSGFVLNGVAAFDQSGYSVSAAGDVNGDGIDDLLIGAFGADPNGSGSGASYVVFGASGVGSGGTLELSALDGNTGFVLNGVAVGDRSGRSVSAAGDVNGDGIDDLLIGALTADPNGDLSGASYVVFGQSSDSTPPTANPNQSPAANSAGWNNSDVTVNWNWSDGTGVGIDGSNCTLSSVSSGEGVQDLSASCADLAGNTGTASYTVQVDKTTPDTTIDVTPPTTSNSTDSSFEFSGTDVGSGVAGFECQLDDAGYAPCISAQNYNTLSEGNHSFEVRAIDHADNVDATPASFSWTINTNVPPQAMADSYSTDQDTVLTVPAPGVLDNDSDADGNPLTAVLDTPPTNGTLNLNADGSFDYTPNAGYVGSDSFSYHVNDGTVDSNIVTVDITVNEVTTVFASCGGYEVFETAPGVYEAPNFAGNLIVGTNGRDIIKGTNGSDLILGLDGADDIKGKRGDDVICGGKGADFIRGNNGQDILYGDAGLDWLIGGNGADTLYGGKGWDFLEGNKGRDSLFGEAGSDVLLGGRGNDELDGGNGFDICTGGSGNDTLSNC